MCLIALSSFRIWHLYFFITFFYLIFFVFKIIWPSSIRINFSFFYSMVLSTLFFPLRWNFFFFESVRFIICILSSFEVWHLCFYRSFYISKYESSVFIVFMNVKWMLMSRGVFYTLFITKMVLWRNEFFILYYPSMRNILFLLLSFYNVWCCCCCCCCF